MEHTVAIVVVVFVAPYSHLNFFLLMNELSSFSASSSKVFGTFCVYLKFSLILIAICCSCCSYGHCWESLLVLCHVWGLHLRAFTCLSTSFSHRQQHFHHLLLLLLAIFCCHFVHLKQN